MRFKMFDEAAQVGVVPATNDVIGMVADGLLVESAPVGVAATEEKPKKTRRVIGMPNEENVRERIKSLEEHLSTQAQVLRDHAKTAKAHIDAQFEAQIMLAKSAIDEKLRSDLAGLRNAHKVSLGNWQRVLDTITKSAEKPFISDADEAALDALMVDPEAPK